LDDTQGNTAYARLVDFEKNKPYTCSCLHGGGVDIETVKPYFDVIVKSFKYIEEGITHPFLFFLGLTSVSSVIIGVLIILIVKF
jgi:hypothetical protein